MIRGLADGSHDNINATPREVYIIKKWMNDYGMPVEDTMEHIRMERAKFNSRAHNHMNRVAR